MSNNHPYIIEPIIIIPPSESVAKLATYTEPINPINYNGVDIPVTRNYQGDAYFIPSPKPNTIFIVSKPIAMKLIDRDDLYVVNGIIRDRVGKILGARSLARLKDTKYEKTIKPHNVLKIENP